MTHLASVFCAITFIFSYLYSQNDSSVNTYYFNMYDSYGDGWNGATYTITDENGNTVASGGLAEGFYGYDTIYLENGTYELAVGGGWWDYEISWDIEDMDGNTITSGSAGNFEFIIDCDDGYVDDCSGDGDCCSESWIGDGSCDGEDQEWGCDLTCYDNDGGDCDEGCAEDEFDCLGDGSECIPEYWVCNGWDNCSNGADEDDCTLPDLKVTSFSVSEVNPEIGDDVTYTIVITNQGTGNASSIFYIDLYLNLIYPPVPGQSGNIWWEVPGLAPGAAVTKSETVIQSSPGYWYSYAQVDHNQGVDESNEGNNIEGPIDIAWYQAEILNNYGWPIQSQSSPHYVNSVLDEYRDDPDPHFHNGIDIQATQNTSVYSVSSGILSYPPGGGIRVGNFVYVHLEDYDPNLPPVNKWVTHAGFRLAETDSENHVHFIDGPYANYINPIRDNGISPVYVDNLSPQIGSLIIKDHETGDVIPDHDKVKGEVDFIAQVKDHIWTSGNRNGIYKLGYEIVGAGVQENSYQFDRWLTDTYFSLVFPQTPEPNSGYIYYNVTNHMVGETTVVEGFWDSNSVNDGAYQVCITAEDIAQNVNVTTKCFDIEVDQSAEMSQRRKGNEKNNP
tara:strand:+ start:195 stop:2042 length:1848 start_codon:yes stop_codon:yes gene_type:complete